MARAALLFLLALFSLDTSFALQLNLTGFPMPSHGFNFNAAAAAACETPAAAAPAKPEPMKLQLSRRAGEPGSYLTTARHDAARLRTIAKKARGGDTGAPARRKLAGEEDRSVTATVESGVDVGSGEYLVDAYVGTPPRHYAMILDTGSDLNWLQCAPCRACFPQRGPVFDPSSSSSFRNVSCGDARCRLVAGKASPECRSPEEPCPYYYWYGDLSNTTGELALEAFTVNLTASVGGTRRVDGVVFGCGHWNRGLFHGAAGLLGLGRGPLSFASQLRSVYGHGAFSYCFVDHGTDMSISGKLVLGHDPALSEHPLLNYTAFAGGKAETFYYVNVKAVYVGGERVDIAAGAWEVDGAGAGGTIVDSGTTLTYFREPAYRAIREAFVRKVKAYPVVAEFPLLSPCYNVSGAADVRLPEFAVEFADGAVWSFPQENYFVRIEPGGLACLALLGTPRSSLNIIGNFLQQNFHVVYDTERSRLGFAPARCAGE